MAMAEMARRVEAGRERMLGRLRQLVEIESPSEDKAAVNRGGRLVEEWIEAAGGKVKRHENELFGDLIEAKFGGTRPKRGRVLLLGHLDTVWPMGTLREMPWREVEDAAGRKLCGPGVLDMKAGVVMALEALGVAQALSADRSVTLLLNSDEEVGSPVSRAITERVARGCAAVFVLEPAQGIDPNVWAYKTARKGVGHYALEVTGVAAHSGVDFERGHSAVLEMARLVQTIAGFTDLGKGLTFNTGVITGGTRSNVVASRCSAEIDVRIVKASDAARVERLMRGLKTTDKACKLTVTGGINRPPMERKAGTIRLFRQARALAAEMGLTLEEAATGGGSDGNFTAALGVPTLDGMGAVGAGAHAAHEYILEKHLVERTALLAGMIVGV